MSDLCGDGGRLCLIGRQEEAGEPDVREAPQVLENDECRALRECAQFHFDDLDARVTAGGDREGEGAMLADDFEHAGEDQRALLGLDDKLCHVRAVDLGKFGSVGKGYRRSIVLLDHVSPCSDLGATDQARSLDYRTQQAGMSGALR